MTKINFLVLVGILFFVTDSAHANGRRPIGRVFGGAARAIGATARFGGRVVVGTAIGGARIVGGAARFGGRVVVGTAIGGARIVAGAGRLAGALAVQPLIGARIAIDNARERRLRRACFRCGPGNVNIQINNFEGPLPGPQGGIGGGAEPVSATGDATPITLSHGNSGENGEQAQEAALPVPSQPAEKSRAVSDSQVPPGANFRINVGAGSCLATMVPASAEMPATQCQAVVANACLPDDALPESFGAGSSLGDISLAGKAVEAFPGSEGTKTVRLRFACPVARESMPTMPVEVAEQMQQKI